MILVRSEAAATDASFEDLALPGDVRALVFDSGKIGHMVHCLGVARALGLDPLIAPLRPRAAFAALAPYGPIDPRYGPRRPGSPLAPPYPDIVFASGRATVPYFRALKRLSGGRCFCVFLQDPRWSRSAADLIWVPEHDKIRGDRIVATVTSPHSLHPAALAQARRTPDPRIAALPAPRLALVLGGPSGAYQFRPSDLEKIAAIAAQAQHAGYSVMGTPSRRTPEKLIAAVRYALKDSPQAAFVWDGAGENPYLSMLANADVVIVTADSVNMVGEALATPAPVYVYEPTGGDAKMRGFIDRLEKRGALRRWRGEFSVWTREPLDATIEIARAVRERFLRFQGARNLPREL